MSYFYCATHDIHYNHDCPKCLAAERHWELLNQGQESDYRRANPGDFECPHCKYISLKRGAARCPHCRGHIRSDDWIKLEAADKAAKRAAAEREKEAADVAEQKQRASARAAETEATDRLWSGILIAITSALILGGVVTLVVRWVGKSAQGWRKEQAVTLADRRASSPPTHAVRRSVVASETPRTVTADTANTSSIGLSAAATGDSPRLPVDSSGTILPEPAGEIDLDTAKKLVGTWRGTWTNENTTRTFSSDGIVVFRRDNGSTSRGRWSVSNGDLYVVTFELNGNPVTEQVSTIQIASITSMDMATKDRNGKLWVSNRSNR